MSGESGTATDYRWDELQARTSRLELRVDELDALFPSPVAAAPITGGGRAGDFPDLETWVVDFLAPTFARAVGGDSRWCIRWSEHREVVYRLDALWRAWETLRGDSRTGDALWLRDHLDPQLGVLFSARGPFAQCTPVRHDAPPALPSHRSTA